MEGVERSSPVIFLVVNEIRKRRAAILESRRRFRAEYGMVFDSVAALLFQYDPIGMIFEGDTNADEYEPEARTILPRLRGCHSADDVHTIVHNEFVR